MKSGEDGKEPPRFQHRTYGEEERLAIRLALIRYKEKSGIRELTVLAGLIAKANGRSNRIGSDGRLREEVSRRRLKRFIDDSHWTDDEFVEYCDIFLKTIEPPPPYEVMGDAIVEFFDRVPKDLDLRAAHGGYAHRQFARRYRCYLRGERTRLQDEKEFIDPDWPAPAFDPAQPVFEIPYARIDIEPLAGSSYYVVRERVVNPARSAYWGRATRIGSKLAAASEAENHIGVLTLCLAPQLCLIALRQNAFHFPKFYMIFDQAQGPENPHGRLFGSCLAVGADLAAHTPTETFDVMFDPVTDR